MAHTACSAIATIVFVLATGVSTPLAAATTTLFTDLASFNAAVGRPYDIETFNGPDSWIVDAQWDSCRRSFQNVTIDYDCHQDLDFSPYEPYEPSSLPYLYFSTQKGASILFGNLTRSPYDPATTMSDYSPREAVAFDYSVPDGGTVEVAFSPCPTCSRLPFELSGTGFIGVISPEGFTSIGIGITGGSSSLIVDNLRTTTVPEPGTLLLLAFGVAGAFLVRAGLLKGWPMVLGAKV
jgi:hypothetical protein